MLVLPTVALAQPEPTFDTRFQFISQAAVEDAVAGLSGDELKLEVATLEVRYTHPLQLSPSRVLLNRFNFRTENVEAETDTLLALFESQTPGGQRQLVFRSESFVRLGYDAVLEQRLSPAWRLTGSAGAQLSVNDAAAAGPGDLAYRGGAQLDYTTGSGWILGLGAVYSEITGQGGLYPLVHVEKGSEASAGWRLLIQTPRAAAWYRPGAAAVEYGLIAEIDGVEYRLLDRSARLYDRQGRVVDESTEVSVAYSVVTLGGAVRLVEIDGVAAFLQVGMALARRYDFRSLHEGVALVVPAGAARGAGEELDFDLARAAFVQGNIQYRFGAPSRGSR